MQHVIDLTCLLTWRAKATNVRAMRVNMRLFGTISATFLAISLASAATFAAAHTAPSVDKSAEAARLTIAVAPFVTSSDQEYRWIGLGLAQGLVNQLLEVKEINTVTVRQLASAVRKDNLKADDLNDEKTADHLGVQLGADSLIIGSFTAEWPEITVVARIYRIKDKKVEKSFFFNGNIEDFFTLEKDLAKSVFQQLNIKSEPNMAALGTKNLYAYHQAAIGFELVNWQSMSPRADITLPIGSIKKAKVHFEKALRLDPAYADAHAGIAQTLTFLGEYDNALKEYAIAQQNGAFNQQAVLGKAYADLRSGRTDDAIKGLDGSNKARPGFVHALGTLGDAYNHMGRHREALATFTRYNKVDPTQPWVLMQLGYTKSKLKRYDEAIADTKKAVEMLPDSISFKVELASRYIDAEKFADAEEVLRKALEKSPKHPTMNVRLGYIYLLQRKIDQAVPVLERALTESQIASDHSRTRQLALYDLARCMAVKKDKQRALGYLEDAVKAGFKDLDDLEEEEDFEDVRKDPKFKQILDLAKKPSV